MANVFLVPIQADSAPDKPTYTRSQMPRTAYFMQPKMREGFAFRHEAFHRPMLGSSAVGLPASTGGTADGVAADGVAADGAADGVPMFSERKTVSPSSLPPLGYQSPVTVLPDLPSFDAYPWDMDAPATGVRLDFPHALPAKTNFSVVGAPPVLARAPVAIAGLKAPTPHTWANADAANWFLRMRTGGYDACGYTYLEDRVVALRRAVKAAMAEDGQDEDKKDGPEAGTAASAPATGSPTQAELLARWQALPTMQIPTPNFRHIRDRYYYGPEECIESLSDMQSQFLVPSMPSEVICVSYYADQRLPAFQSLQAQQTGLIHQQFIRLDVAMSYIKDGAVLACVSGGGNGGAQAYVPTYALYDKRPVINIFGMHKSPCNCKSPCKSADVCKHDTPTKFELRVDHTVAQLLRLRFENMFFPESALPFHIKCIATHFPVHSDVTEAHASNGATSVVNSNGKPDIGLLVFTAASDPQFDVHYNGACKLARDRRQAAVAKRRNGGGTATSPPPAQEPTQPTLAPAYARAASSNGYGAPIRTARRLSVVEQITAPRQPTAAALMFASPPAARGAATVTDQRQPQAPADTESDALPSPEPTVAYLNTRRTRALPTDHWHTSMEQTGETARGIQRELGLLIARVPHQLEELPGPIATVEQVFAVLFGWRGADADFVHRVTNLNVVHTTTAQGQHVPFLLQHEVLSFMLCELRVRRRVIDAAADMRLWTEALGPQAITNVLDVLRIEWSYQRQGNVLPLYTVCVIECQLTADAWTYAIHDARGAEHTTHTFPRSPPAPPPPPPPATVSDPPPPLSHSQPPSATLHLLPFPPTPRHIVCTRARMRAQGLTRLVALRWEAACASTSSTDTQSAPSCCRPTLHAHSRRTTRHFALLARMRRASFGACSTLWLRWSRTLTHPVTCASVPCEPPPVANGRLPSGACVARSAAAPESAMRPIVPMATHWVDSFRWTTQQTAQRERRRATKMTIRERSPTHRLATEGAQATRRLRHCSTNRTSPGLATPTCPARGCPQVTKPWVTDSARACLQTKT